MKPNRTTSALLAAALALTAAALALTAASASAGDYNSSRRSGGYHHIKARPSIGYTNPVTRIRGVGTFASSSWALNLDRLGDSIRNLQIGGPQLAPRAKVIDVESSLGLGFLTPRNACSYEAGVCVIRGDR